jgi:aryl-alcohol dehydrogenase-like predicted oxidoreductase
MTREGLPSRTLGKTGLEVTILGFGAMELRGLRHWKSPRSLSQDEAGGILNLVLDSGINFIDTSIEYGMSEEVIGKFLGHRRDEYFLATKCGCPLDAPSAPVKGYANPHVFTREHIVAGVDQSLRRLRTDYLDILQLHMSPSLDRIREDDAIATLHDLKADGKVRFIGSSSVLPDIEDLIALGAFDVFQVPFSALEREHEQIISTAARSGAGIIIRGGVARGGIGSGGARWTRFDQANLGELAGGTSPAEFLLRYTISHPGMSTAIVGTADPGHLKANVAAAAKGPLAADIYAETNRRLDALS